MNVQGSGKMKGCWENLRGRSLENRLDGNLSSGLGTCPGVVQLGGILKYLPFMMVDTRCRSHETDLVGIHNTISCSDQGDIEILWVNDGSIPACLILHSVVSPFPWSVAPKGADTVSPPWLGSWPCTAGTDAHSHPSLVLTLSWRKDLLPSGKGGQTSF